MQSWCRIKPLNGSRRIRAKTKHHKKPREACKSSWNPIGIFKSFTHNFLEFGKACEDLSWNRCTSAPHRSETNGIAERAMRRVKQNTSAVLLQSGLNESWWADSMECYTYLRNVTDLLSDGKTSYERRFGQPFKGPIIPFGSLVEYHPKTAKDQSRIHQFGKFYLDCSSDALFTRGDFGRVTYWSQTLRSWKRWTHRKSSRKDSMCVKSTSPVTENHYKNGYENCTYSMMSNEDNNHDTNYINKHKYTDTDTRKLHL